MPSKEIRHGEWQGYKQHLRRGEKPVTCAACKQAWRAYIRTVRNKGKEAEKPNV